MSKKQQPKFRIGDIVKLDVRPVFRRKGAKVYINGKATHTSLYDLPGTNAHMVMYANFLVKRHFVVVDFVRTRRPEPSTVRLSLLENFKPGVYGKGWSISVRDRNIIAKTGRRIIDIRELGETDNTLQKTRNDYLVSPPHALTQEGRATNFLRRNILHFRNKDLLAENYAHLMFMSHQCGNCGYTLMYSDVFILKADGASRMKDWINKINGWNVIIFPAYSMCSRCSSTNLLIGPETNVTTRSRPLFDFGIFSTHDEIPT